MPNTTNGLPYPEITAANNPPADFQALALGVDGTYGGKVATATDLPVTGTFPGQRIWLVDVKGWGVWDGAAWVTDTAWAAPTLASGWTQGVTNGTQYLRRGGFVTVQIFVLKANFNDGETIFTLPAGFRPSRTIYFAGHYSTPRAFLIEAGGAVKSNTTSTTGSIGAATFPVA